MNGSQAANLEAARGKWWYGLRALHSLSGVVPVGVFMLLELWAQAKALEGPYAHAEALRAIHPASWGWRLGIGAPLAFHAGMGLVLVVRPRYNVGRYPYSRNWTYTMQRVTAVLALAFIVAHAATLWSVRPEEMPLVLIERLSSTSAGVPWIGVGYMVGLGACAFHFAAGLWTLGIRWGVTPTRNGQAQSGLACALLGVALLGWGGNTILYLATGWRLLPGAPPQVECERCGSSAPPASAAPVTSSKGAR